MSGESTPAEQLESWFSRFSPENKLDWDEVKALASELYHPELVTSSNLNYEEWLDALGDMVRHKLYVTNAEIRPDPNHDDVVFYKVDLQLDYGKVSINSKGTFKDGLLWRIEALDKGQVYSTAANVQKVRKYFSLFTENTRYSDVKDWLLNEYWHPNLTIITATGEIDGPSWAQAIRLLMSKGAKSTVHRIAAGQQHNSVEYDVTLSFVDEAEPDHVIHSTGHFHEGKLVEVHPRDDNSATYKTTTTTDEQHVEKVNAYFALFDGEARWEDAEEAVSNFYHRDFKMITSSGEYSVQEWLKMIRMLFSKGVKANVVSVQPGNTPDSVDYEVNLTFKDPVEVDRCLHEQCTFRQGTVVEIHPHDNEDKDNDTHYTRVLTDDSN